MKKIKISTWIHIIMLSFIFIIFAVILIKLVHWSTSSAEIDLESVNTNDFISESEDFFATTDISTIENYQDDGELIVVMLGDDSLSDYEDGSGVPASVEQIISETQPVTIYNCNFAGSTMTSGHIGFDGTYGDDAFSFYYVSMCILNDTYELLYQGLETAQIKDKDYEAHIETLESIDFSKVDVLVISYGAQDYLNHRYVIPESETEDLVYTQQSTIFTDALTQGITWIQMAYPQIQFVVMSPTFCYYIESDGTKSNCDVRKNNINGCMSDYMVCEKIAAVNANVTFLDNYWGIPIYSENADEYLTESTTYPNAKGRMLIAEKLANTLATRVLYDGS